MFSLKFSKTFIGEIFQNISWNDCFPLVEGTSNLLLKLQLINPDEDRRWGFPYANNRENILGRKYIDSSNSRYVQNNYDYKFFLQVISVI